MLDTMSVPNRRPRPSLAIFDPLASIDIASLPPLPCTPPASSILSQIKDHAPYLSLDSTSVTVRHDTGHQTFNNASAGHPFFPNTETYLTMQKPGKLVDIVTPMPIIGRTLHSSDTRPARDVASALVSGDEYPVDTGPFGRPVQVILEQVEDEEEALTTGIARNEDVLACRDDTPPTGDTDMDAQSRISTIVEEEEPQDRTQPVPMLSSSSGNPDAPSPEECNRGSPASVLHANTTLELAYPESPAVTPATMTTKSTDTEPPGSFPLSSVTPVVRPYQQHQNVKHDDNDIVVVVEETETRMAQPLFTSKLESAEQVPTSTSTTSTCSTTTLDATSPIRSDVVASDGNNMGAGDISRFPALDRHRRHHHPDRGDKTAGGTTIAMTTTMTTMTMDLMDEDQSFMEAMMRSSLVSPSSSSSRSANKDNNNDDEALIVPGSREEDQSPQRLSGSGNDVEATPMIGRWKGKGRAMDLVPASTEGDPSPSMRRRDDPGKPSRNAFGSVLAGMAEYEATMNTRSVVGIPPLPGHDKDRPDLSAWSAEKRANGGEEGESALLTSGLKVVVSEASDSPSSLATRDLPSIPMHQVPHRSSVATTSIPDNALLSVHRQDSTKTTAQGGEEGDISTVFPSSPSIKRYMNTQRAEERARAHEQVRRSAVSGSSRSSATSLGKSKLDDGDMSRLDMVDLSDLRKPAGVHGGQRDRADESISFLDTSMLVPAARVPYHPGPRRHEELDRSTIYPSSPAVKRNMEQRSMTVDLLKDEIGLGDFGRMDSRLEDQSVMIPFLQTENDTRSRIHSQPVDDRYLTATASASSSTSTTRYGATSSDNEDRRDTRKATTKNDDADMGDQTLDIGALIKKTGRKLASDMMIADSTFSGSDFLGLGSTGSRARSSGSRAQGPEMSMLLDTKSPFKPRNTAVDSSSSAVFGSITRVNGNLAADESYYDLLEGDNTFMKEVGDVTVGGDTLILSPSKGNILPPALLNHALPAAKTRPTTQGDFQFKIPELPRGISPSKSLGLNLTERNRSPPQSLTRHSQVLPKLSTRLSPVRATLTSGGYSLSPVTPGRADSKTSTAGKFIPSTTRVSATPRSAIGTEYKRPTVSNYRPITALPPRTPLAERGYGPQSAKKGSTSSLTSVLHETDGRTINTRDPTTLTGPSRNGTASIKRSATLNDFSPVKNRESDGESTVTKKRYPIEHSRTRSDVPALNRTTGDLTAATGAYKRPSTVSSSPSRISRASNASIIRPSQIRLPGQGLRQVSGQQEAENPDARSRKQAMSPDKLLKGSSLPRTEGGTKRPSPPRMRAGFRPTTTRREGSSQVPERLTGRQQIGIPSRSQSSVALAPASRSGIITSTATARSSGMPPPSSASSGNLSRLSSQPTTRLPLTTGARIPASSAASLAGRTTTGLPKPTTGVRSGSSITGSSTSSVVRSGSTASIASTGRTAAPLASRSRTATTSSAYGKTVVVSDKGVVPPKREATDIRARIERPRQQPR
ncbi:hypothetical protein QFC24_005866 [Naganishia onofrii]|uniref:Uncharacterized protein n=1 Tax=Naganishia onofrii TaxID=1851511 RepID=A0ACC2X547_9TREE|nr:hypothetical protein QFC24_005866 [Naganishia onofrii]